jgi:hypothetical protein
MLLFYAIIVLMHKGFYASGFLYHLPSEQILLQQQHGNDKLPLWSLFGEPILSSETAEVTFQRAIYSLLNIKLALKSIYPIYTYFHKDMGKNNTIVYAEVKKLHRLSSVNTVKYAWFTLKQVFKLQLLEQTKHDIIIGQRVINARMRKSLGLQTLE